MHAIAPARSRRMPTLLVALALIAGAAAPAAARSEKTLGYPRDQAWPTAVRFLVVNERVKINEKDADAGYVVFELRDDGKLFRGSLEIVPILRDGQPSVRFVLQIADRPSWVEIAMLGRLERKLRAELGSPPDPPKQAPPKKDAPRDEPKPDAPKAEEPKRDDPPLDDLSPPITSKP